MDHFNHLQRIRPSVARLVSNTRFELSRTGSLITIAAVVALATGGLLLINYPLETIIVLIFAVSVVSLSRM
ncbi:MAG TPA: hypothetical protein VGD99_17655 [Anaerolineae bacterium]|jgi:hypothetical protein